MGNVKNLSFFPANRRLDTARKQEKVNTFFFIIVPIYISGYILFSQ